MKLYGYFRSSATYRVRIALNLKGLEAEVVPVNLLKGEQKSDSYTKINPQQLVPALVDGEHVLTQSVSIIEYLEEKYPTPALLPQPLHERARVRAIALAVACEIAPLANLGPLNFLTQQMKLSDEQKMQWYRHWLARGFAAVEQMLASSPYTGSFCHGSAPTLADCCLVPQVFNARRFECDLTPYPTLAAIAQTCEQHPAFIAAHPSKQPDAV